MGWTRALGLTIWNQIDFKNWMSFLTLNHFNMEINPKSEALGAKSFLLVQHLVADKQEKKLVPLFNPFICILNTKQFSTLDLIG